MFWGPFKGTAKIPVHKRLQCVKSSSFVWLVGWFYPYLGKERPPSIAIRWKSANVVSKTLRGKMEGECHVHYIGEFPDYRVLFKFAKKPALESGLTHPLQAQACFYQVSSKVPCGGMGCPLTLQQKELRTTKWPKSKTTLLLGTTEGEPFLTEVTSVYSMI